MARRIHPRPHLSTAELERRSRQAGDGPLCFWSRWECHEKLLPWWLAGQPTTCIPEFRASMLGNEPGFRRAD